MWDTRLAKGAWSWHAPTGGVYLIPWGNEAALNRALDSADFQEVDSGQHIDFIGDALSD
jgi:hypothetical protein